VKKDEVVEQPKSEEKPVEAKLEPTKLVKLVPAVKKPEEVKPEECKLVKLVPVVEKPVEPTPEVPAVKPEEPKKELTVLELKLKQLEDNENHACDKIAKRRGY